MAQVFYKANAPGSLMLMGEHAVLHGKTAIVCAIDKRIHVTLQPHAQNEIIIEAKNLGRYQTDRHTLQVAPPFRFVLQAIQNYQTQLPSGFNLTINSEFSPTVGLGSSAAVTVATIAVLLQWIKQQPAKVDEIFTSALQVVRQVQGTASGADVAASVEGGTLEYRLSSVLEKCVHQPPLTVVYAGYKTPTIEVIRRVEEQRHKQPAVFEAVFSAMEQCTQAAVAAIQQANWQQLGELANIAQGLMTAISVNDTTLQQLIDQLRAHPTIYGAKISGAGLGDCVIGIGQLSPTHSLSPLDVRLSLQGFCYEGC